ncbi:cellulose binding domain-containing protein [Micromonospora sp. NPDC047557]|uniref:cellulose binding domain-containing protein n=1 Tax=Micromonospora sp. NPDC047557 TaxID=3364250 RepID=UPI0037227933
MAEVTIINTGSSTINGWTVNYNLPSGQNVTNAWSVTVTQIESGITSNNVSYNGTLSPGTSANFGH